LKDAIAYLECTVAKRMECGDHWLVYATVDTGGQLLHGRRQNRRSPSQNRHTLLSCVNDWP
jgi:flavin reductase (DIM6/NTAB) family NADH-FMN oxidoreductase RutF